MEQETQRRWVARLLPAADSSVETLLAMALGLDVWERLPDGLIVAASEAQLAEIERRRLGRVNRIVTVAEYLSGAKQQGPNSAETNESVEHDT